MPPIGGTGHSGGLGAMRTLRATPVGAPAGTVRVPTDKSITHRALLLAAVSDRTGATDRPVDSADSGATRGEWGDVAPKPFAEPLCALRS